MDYKSLPLGEKAPQVVNAVIEIPFGSSNKYEFDVQLKVFKLDRVLYSAVHYPTDYGFIPNTLAPDGDPLDVLVLISRPTFPGCGIECAAGGDPRFHRVETLDDVEPHLLKEVEHFFNVYKDLEGRASSTFGWFPREEAYQKISEYRLK